jgi:predicted O-linked N-acetylglucosamine transferase (SPINDLY family)
MATSLLTAIDVPEQIASDLKAYEDLAVELGTDKTRLAAVRRKVQLARSDSRLFDTPIFVADLENKLMAVCGYRPQGVSV